MAFLTQNMNQASQQPILGQVDMIPSPNIVSAQINPGSVAVIQAGSPVKLVAGVSKTILVDACTGPTDGPVFGVIPYNERKNTYTAGSPVEVACDDSYVWLLASAAVNRGAIVSGTAATTTADPYVTTDTTSGHFIVGVAVDQIAAAGLVRVRINGNAYSEPFGS